MIAKSIDAGFVLRGHYISRGALKWKSTACQNMRCSWTFVEALLRGLASCVFGLMLNECLTFVEALYRDLTHLVLGPILDDSV